MVFFVFAFLVYSSFVYLSRKYNNPHKLIFIFGKKGSGKSTYMVYLMLRHLKRGWTVYTNMYDVCIPGVRFMDTASLKTSLHADETLNKADTETNKGNDNESLKQRIGSDSTDKGTDPSHRRSDHATRIGKDSGKSTSGRSRSRAYHLSKIFAGRYIQAIWIKSRMILIVRIAKAKPMK